MSELEDTIKLANMVLDRPYADPDDDLAMLSRQFLRALERVATAEAKLTELHWGTPAAKRRAEKTEADARILYAALIAARNELGVPQPGYPAPVANAAMIIALALDTVNPQPDSYDLHP